MSSNTSEIGEPSRVFQGTVGSTIPADRFAATDYLIDPARYDSEGNWAFCVFDNERFPLARFGFQRGGFNIAHREAETDPSRVQLHLELVTDQGGVLWVPTGRFDMGGLRSDADEMNIRLRSEGQEIFSIQGWPDMRWHFRSQEGDAEIDLGFSVSEATILPDCVLPYCVFSMWEIVAPVSGRVRYRDRTEELRGRVFYDHPRVMNKKSDAEARTRYLYTAVSFEDGSAWYSYHAWDRNKQPIPYYCFGDFISADSRHRFSTDTEVTDIQLDEDHLPRSWSIAWAGEDHRVKLQVRPRPFSILKSWGSDFAPKDRKEFWIYPFVLDCTAQVESAGAVREIRGRGITEYVDLEQRFPSAD